MEEAIAAVATGNLRAAIGIVRLSGEGCIQAAARLFVPLTGGTLTDKPPRALIYGSLADGAGSTLDHVLATYTPGPNSYTGEDTAEFHCHGSPTVLTMVLEALFAQGVRMARPGEFTRRAFLNGKLDLLEAEGVIDLIDATSPAAARQAAGQLGGALSGQIEGVYSSLVDLLAHFHATVDYPDEDLAPFDGSAVTHGLTAAASSLRQLLRTYQRGQYLRDGVPCAIVGRPNVGKSTLLNALVGYDRAIVTEIPGTTRDTVEETCTLGSLPLRLIDTAGLRDTSDPVERLGVERSRKALREAALALVLRDPGMEPSPDDEELLTQAREQAGRVILVYTKADLHPGAPLPAANVPAVALSARTGEGLDRLTDAVEALFPQDDAPQGQLLTNARQAEAARRALTAVEQALAAHNEGLPPDVVLLDVEEGLTALGELTGRVLREDVVDRIFSRFCVGK